MSPIDSHRPHGSDSAHGAPGVAALLGIDIRSLALFRIALAAIILYDLAERARLLEAHYTDQGALPLWAAWKWLGVQAWVVVHAWGGSTGYEAALFVLASIFAVAMLVGYRTRLATVVSWFLLCSLQARNPGLGHGGDTLLRVMMFWAMFLPLGSCWSIDAGWSSDAGGGRPARRVVVSAATFAVQLQLCLMYWVSGILKWQPAWLEGRAIEMALSIDHLTTSLGQLLLAWPELLQGLTFLTLGLELVGPALVWVPVWTGPIRFAVVLAFVGFHLMGLAPTMVLDIFPWVCAAAWLVFLPNWMWERLERGRSGFPQAVRRLFARLAARWPLPRRETERGPRHPALRRLETVVVVAALILVAMWNLAALDPERYARLTPRWLDPLGRMTGFAQGWAMFAPPPSEDGWWVMPGVTEQGRELDVWTGEPVSWNKPRDVAALYEPQRWNKYMHNLERPKYLYHRPLFGEYMCRVWNERLQPEDRLVRFEMILMVEEFDAPRQPPAPRLLWVQRCDRVRGRTL